MKNVHNSFIFSTVWQEDSLKAHLQKKVQVEGSVCLENKLTDRGSELEGTESLNESVLRSDNQPIYSISVTMQLRGAQLPQNQNPDLFLTKCLVLLNRNHCVHIQSNYCRTNPSQEREEERLFLSCCLHYSCKKLHAGQWISRKSETAAVDNGSNRDQGSDASVRRWMVQNRLSSGEVLRGRNRWRYDKYGRYPKQGVS